MYFEINVSLNGRHFFATAKRSLTNEAAALEMVKLFSEKFPKSEGYELSLSRDMESSTQLDIDSILNPADPEESAIFEAWENDRVILFSDTYGHQTYQSKNHTNNILVHDGRGWSWGAHTTWFENAEIHMM